MEGLKMEHDQTNISSVCRNCGSTQALAAADARALGILNAFVAGVYTCCQTVQWADEQWLAWQEAACEDGKDPEEVTSPLKCEPDVLFVPANEQCGERQTVGENSSRIGTYQRRSAT
jgi:hypothetical protein